MSNETQLSAAEKAMLDENPVVRWNLIRDKNYRGFCGGDPKKCSWPRTRWDNQLGQFWCPECGWKSQYPTEFIALYRRVHGLAIDATTINQ